MKIIFSYIFLFAKDYRSKTSGWQGALLYFRRYGRGLVSKPAFVKEMLGGLPLNRSFEVSYLT